jgi:hypothetical protein
MTPTDRVAQLYPQALGSILVAFYDMHGLQWDYSLNLATTREIENYAILESIFREKKCRDEIQE